MNINSLNTFKSISYLKKAKFVEKIGGGANLNTLLCHFPNFSVEIEPFAVNFFEGISIMLERGQNLNLAGLSIFGRFWPIFSRHTEN